MKSQLPQVAPGAAVAFTPLLLPVALAISLVAGIIGATYVATIDKDFRLSYGRIVDSLVSGTLGAVVGGGALALARRSKDTQDPKPPDQPGSP